MVGFGTPGIFATMKRLHNLDYLRGLCAFCIMLYHYQGFLWGAFPAGTFWGRIGLYGVSIFYVLSGLTLYLVNRKHLEPTAFFIKRVFRIYPLLIGATVGTMIVKGLPPLKMFLLNVTGLFGFFTPRQYIAMGAWSIGNELVFYALFPVLWMLVQFKKQWVLWLAGACLFCLFSFYLLSPAAQLAAQWAMYINPLNQLPYFIIGVLIGQYRRPVPLWINTGLLLLGVVGFLLFPTGTNVSELVTGVNRLFFTLSITLICISFYKSEQQLHPFLHKPLSVLGEASYSVYLLHPLVWWVVGERVQRYLHGWAPILITAAVTILVSYVVYRYFETYFIALGKRLTKKEPGAAFN